MALQAIGNFKLKGKFFKAGDAIPEKAPDGKPFLDAKEIDVLVKEGHALDESKITAKELGKLEHRIGLAKAELAKLERDLDAKKAALAKPAGA